MARRPFMRLHTRRPSGTFRLGRPCGLAPGAWPSASRHAAFGHRARTNGDHQGGDETPPAARQILHADSQTQAVGTPWVPGVRHGNWVLPLPTDLAHGWLPQMKHETSWWWRRMRKKEIRNRIFEALAAACWPVPPNQPRTLRLATSKEGSNSGSSPVDNSPSATMPRKHQLPDSPVVLTPKRTRGQAAPSSPKKRNTPASGYNLAPGAKKKEVEDIVTWSGRNA